MERFNTCNVLRTTPGTYGVSYHVAAAIMIIWMINIIFNVHFFIVNKLSYNMVTQVQLNAALSSMCSFLRRGNICT